MAVRPTTMRGTGRRSFARLLSATVASVALSGAFASAAPASSPWPIDGQNVNNQRSSTQGPQSIGAAKVAWQRTWDAPVTGTPIVADNGGVYVGDQAGDVHAFVYKDGRRVWATGARYIGGPVVGSVLYLSNQKCTDAASTVMGCIYAVASIPGGPRVVALDPLTGELRWQSAALDTQAGIDAWGSPSYSVEKNLIYVPLCACKAVHTAQSNPTNARTPTARGGLVALDATSGALVWKNFTVPATYTGAAVAGTPLVSDTYDRVYVGTDGSFQSTRVHANTDSILAFDTATGALVGAFNGPRGDYFSVLDPTRYIGFGTAPLLFKTPTGKTYVGAGAKDGNFYAINPETMAKVWSAQVAAPGPHAGIQAASAFDKNSKVFGVGATPAAFWGLSATNGALAWLFPGNDAKHTGPVTHGGNYLWSADTLGLLNIQHVSDGHTVTRIQLPGKSTGGVAFGRGFAYVGVGTQGGTSGGVVAIK